MDKVRILFLKKIIPFLIFLFYFLFLCKQYKVGSKETKTQLIHNYRAAAHNYARMVTDISELKYLRGLDTGEKLDPRAKIQATARRVGLSVPHVRNNQKIIL